MSRREDRPRPGRAWEPPRYASPPQRLYPSRQGVFSPGYASVIRSILTRHQAQRATVASGVQVPGRSLAQVMVPGRAGGVATGRAGGRFGNAPLAIVQAHNRVATNYAPVTQALASTRAAVRQARQAQTVQSLVQNTNKVSQNLTPANRQDLAVKGVSQGALRGVSTRKNASCLSDNRPTATRGDGSSRPFVAWCQKGKS